MALAGFHLLPDRMLQLREKVVRLVYAVEAILLPPMRYANALPELSSGIHVRELDTRPVSY